MGDHLNNVACAFLQSARPHSYRDLFDGIVSSIFICINIDSMDYNNNCARFFLRLSHRRGDVCLCNHLKNLYLENFIVPLVVEFVYHLNSNSKKSTINRMHLFTMLILNLICKEIFIWFYYQENKQQFVPCIDWIDLLWNINMLSESYLGR